MANDLERSSAIFAHVASVQDVSRTIDTLLETSAEAFPFDREMLGLLKIVLDKSSKLVTDLFEENRHIYDLVERAMRKNHP